MEELSHTSSVNTLLNSDGILSKKDPDYDLISKYLREDDDKTMVKALKIIVSERKANTTYLQRKMKINYHKAAALIAEMESRGIISQQSFWNLERKILIDCAQTFSKK